MARKLPRTFLRSGRKGATKGLPHVEIPVDGMPRPVASNEADNVVALNFTPQGKIADSETAREMGRRGGLAKVRRLRLIGALGLPREVKASAFGSFVEGAEEFTEFHTKEIAVLAGGECPAGASSMIASAALQLAASRFAFSEFARTSQSHWLKLGSSLADASRQNLLAGYSHAVLSGQARESSKGDEHLYIAKDAKGAKR